MYETVLAWYIFFPTLMAIITPKKGKFNVTEKGGLVDEAYFDWRISIPYLILILLNITGICWGIKRIAAGPEQEIMTVLMNIVWTLYNLLILGGALAVATESKQVRRSHRIDFNLPVTITTENGHIYDAELTDYSETGFGIKINESLHQLAIDQELKVVIERGDITNVFNVKVICLNDNHLGVYFTELTLAESKSLIESTFSRADAWLDVLRSRKREYILPRLKEVALIGLRGYRNFAIYFKNSLKKHCPTLSAILAYFVTFLPKRPIYEN
jgi:cellulose synthase (UDP-forming)